jgi:hypothetical protein
MGLNWRFRGSLLLLLLLLLPKLSLSRRSSSVLVALPAGAAKAATLLGVVVLVVVGEGSGRLTELVAITSVVAAAAASVDLPGLSDMARVRWLCAVPSHRAQSRGSRFQLSILLIDFCFLLFRLLRCGSGGVLGSGAWGIRR